MIVTRDGMNMVWEDVLRIRQYSDGGQDDIFRIEDDVYFIVVE